MRSHRSKTASKSDTPASRFEPLIASPCELTDGSTSKLAIVLTTRIRLARNLASTPFPGWAEPEQRCAVLDRVLPVLASDPALQDGAAAPMDSLGELEKQMLFERHLISRDLMQVKQGAGVAVSRDQTVSVMVNEEDHLRIQVLRSGFALRKVWQAVGAVDTSLEQRLDFAYSPELGYLTACPSNVGTGLRASVMMHLPGLVMAGQMDKVVHALNQLGMVVRGLFGEGSDASGSIFQVSNQMTLGESEDEILKRLHDTLAKLIEQEQNAREKQLDTEPHKLLDKIGRAAGILSNSHVLASTEAMNLLALVRLGIDLGVLPEVHRAEIDRLIVECQPGHVQFRYKAGSEPGERDRLRARLIREAFAPFPPLSHQHLTQS